MIHITAYKTMNGTRSELIQHDEVVYTTEQLNAVKSKLMQSTGKLVDLVYQTLPEEKQPEPEPEPIIVVTKKDLSGVIVRNSIIIRNFINSLKH